MRCEFEDECLVERVEVLEQKVEKIDSDAICDFMTDCNYKLKIILQKLDDSEHKALLKNIEKLSYDCYGNMQKLNEMMKEMKGLIAMVRSSAAKNEWYGEEINGNPKQISIE